MPAVQANGIDIEIRVDGPPNSFPVILSNSLSTDYRMWDDQLPALVDKYRVIRWNKRGHGGSEATLPPYDLPLLAEDVRCLMERSALNALTMSASRPEAPLGSTLRRRNPVV